MKENLREIVEALMKTEKLSKEKVMSVAKKICKSKRAGTIPTNVQILGECTKEERMYLESVLLLKPVRTASGVSVITVVPKPAECPGRCVYCPKVEGSPKSYTGTEPAIMRAKRNEYDPYRQVRNRLNQYSLMGHPTDKVQIVIIGGTFLALENEYKKNFMKRIFDALNGRDSETLEEAKKLNETAEKRCIGIIIETRPDFCKESHIREMLEYGTTMVEIGVQSVYQKVLDAAERMHTLDDVKVATKLAKDSGLKVNYHMMIGLPGSNRSMDMDQFNVLFEDQSFKPDALKIYPTLVVKGTRLYEMWKAGEYSPMDTEDAIDVITKGFIYIPEYCRIARMQRTMAVGEIEAGVKKNNLRELVERSAVKSGIEIKEIRHREAGRGKAVDYENVKLYRTEYEASGGKEFFLSFEDKKNNTLVGFLRLRIPDEPFMDEILKGTALIRELHVYGQSVGIGKDSNGACQHRGFGSLLISEAEKIAKNLGCDKITIISGVGVREYYRKRGYEKEGVYMSKRI